MIESVNNYPLIVTGMGRSGTKLLRNILNNHSDINLIDEWHDVVKLLLKDSAKKYTEKNLFDELYVDFCKSHYYWLRKKRGKQITLNEIKEYNLAATIQNFIHIICDYYQYKESESKQSKVWGFKVPGILLYYDLILSYFPNAKFIHIIRDPRDRALSYKNTWGKSLLLSVYKYNHIMLSIDNLIGKNTQNYLEIFYEDFINDTPFELKKIGCFLDISFNESHLRLKKAVEKYGSKGNSLQVESSNSLKYLAIKEKKLRRMEAILVPTFKTITKYSPVYDVKQKNLSYCQIIILSIHDGIRNLKSIRNNHGLSGFIRGLKETLLVLLFKLKKNDGNI